MRRLSITIALLIIFGLIVFSLNNEALSGSDARRLQYKFKKGNTLNYRLSQKMEQLMEMMGAEQSSDSETEATYEITLEGQNEAGNLVYTMALSSFKLYIGMLDSTLRDPDGLIGKRVRKEISPDGDQISSTEVDSIKLEGMLGQQFTSHTEFFPDLPRDALEVGKAVKQTDVDTTKRRGGLVISKTEMEYSLVGEETRNGYKCVKLSYKGTVNIEGNGVYQGMMKYFLEGDGDVEGVIYFAPDDGILVSVENQSEVELTAAFTGQQSMTVPITQTSKSSITLVK